MGSKQNRIPEGQTIGHTAPIQNMGHKVMRYEPPRAWAPHPYGVLVADQVVPLLGWFSLLTEACLERHSVFQIYLVFLNSRGLHCKLQLHSHSFTFILTSSHTALSGVALGDSDHDTLPGLPRPFLKISVEASRNL